MIAYKEICIWGFGKIGKSYALLTLKCAGSKVVCYCDSQYQPGESFEGIPLISKQSLFNMKNIFVVIAIKSIDAQDEILEELKNHSINAMVFDNCTFSDICRSIDSASDHSIKEKYKILIDDSLYLKNMFKLTIGKELFLDNPRSFNEKLLWLKINDRKDIYKKIVDKAEVKSIVGETIGDGYIIPTYGVYNRFEDIPFDRLPDSFVMKCTHDSGSTVICKDKRILDFGKAKKKINRALSTNMYWSGREWPYKNITPRIIIEKYMGEDLIDYKFMCYGGEPYYVFTCSERNSSTGLKVTWFTSQWERLDFKRHYPASTVTIDRPRYLGRMIELARELSRNSTFMRTDFYEIDNSIWFGELTLYPGAGFEEFDPYDWDIKLGSKIIIDE